jgi:hypothetical protein
MRTGRSRRRTAAAAALTALLLSGCAAVPDSGAVQAGKAALAAGGQSQNYLQLIPVPPKPGWTPQQVVSGFLAASASFANNHAVARQYLDPAKSNSWNPGWAVTVVGTALTLGKALPLPHQAGLVNEMQEVRATGEQVATLTKTGQYLGTQGKVSKTYLFQLYKFSGQWRIENPPGQLLLTEPDFQRVYQPRNLYFLTHPGQALMPDPVFVPLQATSAELATNLVSALQQDPRGWLQGGGITAFPRGTRLLQVAIDGGTVTVSLGGAAAHASGAVLREMTSQLIWTLASASYGQSAFQSVRLEVSGRERQSATWSGGQPQQAGGPLLTVPVPQPDAPVYVVGASGAVQQLSGSPPSARTVPGAAGAGRVHLTTIAVAPGGHFVAGLTASRRVVYYGAIRRGAQLASWSDGGRFTSLSWDAQGGLWAAGPGGVWMLPARGRPVPLRLGLPGSVVSQLRVAPDGVRVAMIVHGPSGTQLRIGAISRIPGGGAALGSTVPVGADVSSPTQLTWYDADDLIVLSQSSTGPQLQEVPVNGGSSTPLISEPATQSISAAGPVSSNPMVAGLADGQLALTFSMNGTWVTGQVAGLSPTYPG